MSNIEQVLTHDICSNIKVKYEGNPVCEFVATCGGHTHRGKTEKEAIRNLIIFVREKLDEQYD